ncbi:MAG: hypothetical protein J0H09_09775 [Burkholderiales bacterium]|nr:hypothetical protein [Burkholderiales bacterium]
MNTLSKTTVLSKKMSSSPTNVKKFLAKATFFEVTFTLANRFRAVTDRLAATLAPL